MFKIKSKPHDAHMHVLGFSPFLGGEVTTLLRLYFMKVFNEISGYVFLPRMSNKLQKQM